MKSLQPEIQRWIHSLRDLGPLVVVFDVDRQIIGSSVPRWAGRAILEAWQQEQRNDSFPAEVKRYPSEVRGILKTVVAEGGEPATSLVDEGQSAVTATFGADCLPARLRHGSHWLSANANLQALA